MPAIALYYPADQFGREEKIMSVTVVELFALYGSSELGLDWSSSAREFFMQVSIDMCGGDTLVS